MKQKEIDLMDESRHSFSTFGVIPKHLIDISKSPLRVNDNVATCNWNIKKDEQRDDIARTNVRVHKEIISGICTLQFTSKVCTSDLKLPVDDSTATIAQGVINSITPYTDHEQKVISDLGQYANDISMFSNMLKRLFDNKEISITCFTYVNNKLTAAVNRFLVNNLGLHSLTIDNFVDDVHELIKYLGENYGELYSGRFIENAIKFASFVVSYGIEASDVVDYELSEEDRKVCGIHSRYITICRLFDYPHKLKYWIPTTHAVVVTEELTPELYKLCKMTTEFNIDGRVSGRMFISTLHGISFEVFRGVVNNSILIRRFDSNLNID